MSSQTEFNWPVRVYFEDTDTGGVVYHGAYVRFLERARTEWLRARGFHQRALAAESGVLFAVRRLNLDYYAPARLDDVVDVSVYGLTLRRASFALSQTVACEGRVLCAAAVTVACVDAEGFRPRAIPTKLIKRMDV